MAYTNITQLREGQSMSVDLFNATSAAAAGTAYGTTYRGFACWDSITIYGELLGPTGGTLDAYVQTSWDGTTFYDMRHFAQVSAGATPAAKTKWSPTLDDVIYTIGSGTEAAGGVALAAGTGAGGPWGDYLRVVLVTGAGASAGAAQIIRALGVKRSMQK